jgi:short-subunit dehydrogenase
VRSVAAITGASSGIGSRFAAKLAPEHDLLLIARRKDRLEMLAEDLSRRYGTRAEVMQGDLSVEPDLSAVADRIGNEANLALLVNNAGFGTRGLFWEAPLETQEQMHQLHVMATVRLTHAALRRMVARDLGAVINVASIAAFGRTAGSTAYGATKSWMTVFTEALHLELRSVHSHVIVQALCPGFTYSEFHDKMGTSREKAAPPARKPGGLVPWLWMSADEVVEASLAGLQRKRLFVVPGWRYRLIAARLGVTALYRLGFSW